MTLSASTRDGIHRLCTELQPRLPSGVFFGEKWVVRDVTPGGGQQSQLAVGMDVERSATIAIATCHARALWPPSYGGLLEVLRRDPALSRSDAMLGDYGSIDRLLERALVGAIQYVDYQPRVDPETVVAAWRRQTRRGEIMGYRLQAKNGERG